MYPLKPATNVAGGFMLAVLLGHRFTKFAESVSVRSGIPKINRVEMAEFLVALPTRSEQARHYGGAERCGRAARRAESAHRQEA